MKSGSSPPWAAVKRDEIAKLPKNRANYIHVVQFLPRANQNLATGMTESRQQPLNEASNRPGVPFCSARSSIRIRGMNSTQSHTVPIRVRYSETDAMGFLHHGNYPAYFEEVRTELFRVNGGNYREMEERGLFFVVVEMNIKYRKPARYDDVLQVTCWLERASAAKLIHGYRVTRDDEVLTEGTTILAMVDANGNVQRIADHMPGLE